MLTIRRLKRINPVVKRAHERQLAERAAQTVIRSLRPTRAQIEAYISEHHPEVHAQYAPQPKITGLWNCQKCENQGTCDQAKVALKDNACLIERSDGHIEAFELCRGSVYFDYEAEEQTVFTTKEGNTIKIYKAELQTPPLAEYPTHYVRPEEVHEQTANAGIPTAKLRRSWRPLQDLVWVLPVNNRDGGVVVFRRKDLLPNGRVAPGAQVPLQLPYVPNEIHHYSLADFAITFIQGHAACIYPPPRSWQKIGSLSEEQALAKIGYGPEVQPGRLSTSPYFETDSQDLFDDTTWEDGFLPYENDYNGPMAANA